MANFDNALLWAMKMIFRISSQSALDEDFIVVQVRRHSPSLIRQLERCSPSSASLSTRQQMGFLRERLIELRARRPNQLFRTEASDGRFYWRLTPPPPPNPHGNHDDGCPASTDDLPPYAVRRESAVQPTAGQKRQLHDDLQEMADQLQKCELPQDGDAPVQAIEEPAKKEKRNLVTDLSEIAEKLQKCDVQTSSHNEDSHTERIDSVVSSRRSKERGPHRRRRGKARSESSKRLSRPLASKDASTSMAEPSDNTASPQGETAATSSPVPPPSSPSSLAPSPPAPGDAEQSPRPEFPKCSRLTAIKTRTRPLPRIDHHRSGTDGDAARLCRRRQAKARAESCNRLDKPHGSTQTASTSSTPETVRHAASSDHPAKPARHSPQPQFARSSAGVQLKNRFIPVSRRDHSGAASDGSSTRRRKTKQTLDSQELYKSRKSFLKRPKNLTTVWKDHHTEGWKSTGFITNIEPEFVVFEGQRNVLQFNEDLTEPSPVVDILLEADVDDNDVDSYSRLGSDEEEDLLKSFEALAIHDRRWSSANPNQA